MATVPEKQVLSPGAVNILNAIRNSCSANYRDYIPVCKDASNIREIGAIIMDFPALQNEFLNALINRIGLVLLQNKMYDNPLTMFKRGTLDYGETVEEVFVELCRPFQFDPAVAETHLFRREIPDVRTAFHPLNYKKFYKTTVSREQLRQAFLNPDGIENLVTKIIEALYTSANYDEFQVMKYLLAKHILQGELFPSSVPTPVNYNATDIVKQIKRYSNDFTFMKTMYNKTGVHNYTLKDNQYIIMSSEFDSVMDVDVLAAAFNMDKADFMGHKVLVDSFGDIDVERLNELFRGEAWYTALTSDELEALNAIPAVLVDKDWFVIIDNMYTIKNQENSEGLYWNYFYHVWKTFSISPFHNAVVFVPGEPSVIGITLSPTAVTCCAGQSVTIYPVVETVNFAPQTVIWTSSNEEIAIVNRYGEVIVNAEAESGESVTITATSAYDGNVVGEATVTVA